MANDDGMPAEGVVPCPNSLRPIARPISLTPASADALGANDGMILDLHDSTASQQAADLGDGSVRVTAENLTFGASVGVAGVARHAAAGIPKIGLAEAAARPASLRGHRRAIGPGSVRSVAWKADSLPDRFSDSAAGSTPPGKS